MNHSDQVDKLAEALAKAQGKIKGAPMSSENPFYSSRYANLESVWEACRTPLSDNGLSIVQGGSVHDNNVYVTTIMIHASGQWMRSEINLPIVVFKDRDTGGDKATTAQVIGSLVSYGRRYGLAAMVGIYQSDDDAETGEGRGQAQGKPVHYDKVLDPRPEQRAALLPSLVQAIQKENASQASLIWDALPQTDQDGLWKLLNPKQKTSLKALLLTAPRDSPPDLESEAGDSR
jgi:ERF superfamily